MSPSIYDQSQFLILKAAYLYYVNGLTQRSVAEQLDISVPTVSRLLDKAKNEKIVEFVIKDPYTHCIELGETIKKNFKLKDVIIAPTVDTRSLNITSNDADYVRKLVALEGARYLQRVIKHCDVLGIGWGKTVYEMINYLNPSQKVDATFVTLHGSIPSIEDDLDVRTLVSRISKAFCGKNYSFITEGIMESPDLLNLIKSSKNIRRIYKMLKNINISICSVGSFYPYLDSNLAKPEFMSNEELTHLQEKGVVGDIVLRFYNNEGQECESDLKNRVVAIDLYDFKKIPSKIIIASGTRKTYPVVCALKGKLANILIVDYQLGKSILNYES